MHNGGKTINIVSHDYKATIVTVGGGIARLTYKNQDIVIAHDPQSIPLAHLGKMLIPWPNRLANGEYEYNNKHYELAINDRNNNSSIHGLVAWKEWDIWEIYDHKCVLKTNVTPIYGYPFNIAVTNSYVLDENGLHINIELKNNGNNIAPVGIGCHPYLTLNNTPVDEYKLKLPSKEVFTIDEYLNPKDLVDVAKINLDFQKKKVIANTQIDHTFKVCEKNWEATIENNNLLVGMRSNCKYIQVYTGEKLQRKGLAIEPMTCPPNAFNSKIDLINLTPLETCNMQFTIFAG